jgi:hypothetical protein
MAALASMLGTPMADFRAAPSPVANAPPAAKPLAPAATAALAGAHGEGAAIVTPKRSSSTHKEIIVVPTTPEVGHTQDRIIFAPAVPVECRKRIPTFHIHDTFKSP